MNSIIDKIDFNSPIFLVGFPRSGTTLLQTMISTQKNICSFPETQFFNIYRNYKNNFPNKTEEFFSKIEKQNNIVISSQIKQIYCAEKTDTLEKKRMIFEELVRCLLSKQIMSYNEDRLRILEKSPAHIFNVFSIKEIYPDSKFINIIRYPLNSIFSWKNNWNDGHSFSNLAIRFKDGVRYFQEFSKAYPDSALTIKYEDLIKSPDEELSRICSFLDIKFSSSHLKKNMSINANLMIRPHEHWKDKNKSGKIKIMKDDYVWSMRKTLIMQNILKEELLKFKYKMKYPFFQYVFTRLSIVKKLTKNKITYIQMK